MITVNENNGMISVNSPYNADFIAKAKASGGRWNTADKAWEFPSAAKANVKRMVMDAYGVDIDGDTESVMAEITIKAGVAGYPTLGYGPYSIAYSRNKIDAPSIHYGVVIVSGEIESGGSWKSPSCYAKTDVVVQMMLPRSVIGEYDTGRMTARIAE